tara:strand:- start:319 stop:591 length:273 start_codon:yes stop_codon:yes gene_type:complete
MEVTYQGTNNENHDIDSGWTMEMPIPIANFGKSGKVVSVRTGNRLAFMAVRQNSNDVGGNLKSTSTIFPIYDILKNVNQTNRFGLLEFVK